MEITHEPDAHRYVLSEGDEFLGEIEYQAQGTTLLLLRAEVPIEKRGQGLGIPLSKVPLVRGIREEGIYSVTPICPYIAKYMMKNSEFDDLKA
jgi:hypothetical protein